MRAKWVNKSIDELDKLLSVEYKKALAEVYKLLVETYAKITDNDKPLISHLYAYNRYYTLIRKINAILSELGVKEELIFNDNLIKMYEDTTSRLDNQLNLATEIDKEKVIQIINEDWVGDNKSFSDRIWQNKAELMSKVKSNLIQSVITGQSIETYSNNLNDNLINKGYYQIRRLAHTEMSRVNLRATLDKYKSIGLTKITLLEAMDDRTCDYCRERNGTIIDISSIKDGGDLLAHPNCRVSIIANI